MSDDRVFIKVEDMDKQSIREEDQESVMKLMRDVADNVKVSLILTLLGMSFIIYASYITITSTVDGDALRSLALMALFSTQFVLMRTHKNFKVINRKLKGSQYGIVTAKHSSKSSSKAHGAVVSYYATVDFIENNSSLAGVKLTGEQYHRSKKGDELIVVTFDGKTPHGVLSNRSKRNKCI